MRCVLVLLVATYLLQMLSPLRLNTDAIVFLTLGESAASGHGLLFRGRSTHFPFGYPMMLAGLDCARLGASWAFIGLNCLLAGAAVFSSYSLYRRAFGLSGQIAEFLCALLLLCWILIKHVTLPTSDVAFLGWTFLALLACNQAEGTRSSKRGWALTAAAALVIASVAHSSHRPVASVFMGLFAATVAIMVSQLTIQGLDRVGQGTHIIPFRSDWPTAFGAGSGRSVDFPLGLREGGKRGF